MKEKAIKNRNMEDEWIELDEDNNRKDPENGLFCVRCKKPIKDTQSFESFISVEIHPIGPPTMVRRSPLKGKYLIGSECWKKIIKRAQEEMKEI